MTLERESTPVTLLKDRSQYRYCHIQVTETDNPLPAIEFQQQHYYFLRVVGDEHRALHLSNKLAAKGDKVLVTAIPKGYSLWVLEPDVIVLPKRTHRSSSSSTESHSVTIVSDLQDQVIETAPSIAQHADTQVSENTTDTAHPVEVLAKKKPEIEVDAQPDTPTAEAIESLLPFPILLDSACFSDCQIQVPDLDETLAAIHFENRYYSFFRVMSSQQELVTITHRLLSRGDDAIITIAANRYSLWVLEPEVTVVSQSPQ